MRRRLGRYRLLRTLATGGMGEIVLAEQTGLSGFCKRVVIKRIRADLARDPDYVRLFLNEARTGSFVNHPNIAHVFDVGHEDGELFLVMEYVDGMDLKRLRRRAALAHRGLSHAALASIAVEVLCALDWAHRGGPIAGAPIIHRDVSPENILITREGYVKVLDFGLAKWWPGSDRVSSREGRMIFGKVRYMPPEQLRGSPIDGRADLFALGVVLYEALTGDLPFGRGSANEVLARVRAGPPPPPTEQTPHPDPDLDALVLQALVPDPDARFANAEAMRTAFVSYLQARGALLPREELRALLRATSRPSLEAASHLPATLDRHAATELSLPVADRCGKCGGELHAYRLDDLILDQCGACFGTWVDRSELDRILGRGLSRNAPSGPAAPAVRPLDQVLGACPVDRVGLVAFEVPGRDFSVEVCPMCRGAWFDEDELSSLSEGEVVDWLRGALGRVV